jgi:hypothetical protein
MMLWRGRGNVSTTTSSFSFNLNYRQRFRVSFAVDQIFSAALSRAERLRGFLATSSSPGSTGFGVSSLRVGMAS